MFSRARVARRGRRVTALTHVCLNLQVLILITFQLSVNRWEGVVPGALRRVRILEVGSVSYLTGVLLAQI